MDIIRSDIATCHMMTRDIKRDRTMEKQRKLTLLMIALLIAAMILEIFYIVDYQIKGNQNYETVIRNNLNLKDMTIVGVVSDHIDELDLRLQNYASLFVDQDIAFDDQSFLDSMTQVGYVSMIEINDLTPEMESQINQQQLRYTTESNDFIILVPIEKENNTIGYLISRIDESNFFDQLIRHDDLMTTQTLHVMNQQGQFMYNNLGYTDLNATFDEIYVYEYDIVDATEFMKTHTETVFRGHIDNHKYYFYFSDFGYGLYFLQILNSTNADSFYIVNQSIIATFLTRTIALILILIGGFFIILFYKERETRENELKILALNNSIQAGILLTTFDYNMRILYANSGFYDLVGYTKREVEDLYDNCFGELIYPKDIAICHESITNIKESNHKDIKFRVMSKEGLVWFHMNLSHNPKNGDTLTFVILDITESKLLNTEIKNLVASIPGGVLKLDANSRSIQFVSDSLYSLLGFSALEFKEQFHYFDDLIIQEEKEIFQKQFDVHENDVFLETRIVKKDGSHLWVTLNAKKEMIENQNPVYQCVVIDTTNNKQTLLDLKKEVDRSKAFFEMTDEVICEYDIHEDRLIGGRKFQEVFGTEYALSGFLKNINNPNVHYFFDREQFLDNIGGLKGFQPVYQFDMQISTKDGEPAWFSIKCITLYELNKPYKVLIKITNVDEQKKTFERLLDISQRDSLTGLYNSGNIAAKINEYLGGRGANGIHAMIVIDMDNFKSVNDHYGHPIGDAIIKDFSGRLLVHFGDDSIIGRIGGDEFVVLMKNVNAKLIQSHIKQLQSKLRSPFIINDISIKTTTSFGVALYPSDGLGYEELFKKADVACYVSKEFGKDCFTFYNEQTMQLDSEVKSITYESNVSDKLIMECIDVLGKSLNFYEGIQTSFQLTSNFFDFNCAFIFEYMEDSQTFVCNFVYDHANLQLQEQKTPTAQNVINPAMISVIKKDSLLYIGDVDMIHHELPDLYLILNQKAVKTAMICGIFDEGDLKCVVALGSYHSLEYPNQPNSVALATFSKLIFTNIQKMRNRRLMLAESQMFSGILHNQELTAYVIDKSDYELLYLSPRLEKHLTNPQLNQPCYQIIHGRNTPCENCPIKYMDGGERFSTYQYYEKMEKWLGVTSTAIQWYDETRNAVLLYSFDITSYIEKVSYRDPLTGLFNLTKFIFEGNKLIQTKTHPYIIVSVDISDFRYVNEIYGYQMGDQVLIEVAKLISENMHSGELCCRTSADHFLVLLQYETYEQVLRRIEFLGQKVTVLRKRLIGNTSISFAAGLCIVTEEQDLLPAIDNAELARKAVKHKKRNAILLYDDALLEKFAREKEIESKMEEALKNRRFLVYVQPKYRIDNETIIGCEALVRWQWSKTNILPPIEFIPIFEKNGFIDDMSYYVNEEVFKTIKEWQEIGMPVYPFAINISYHYLINPNFYHEITSLIEKYEISPALVEIELTETIFKESTDQLIDILTRLKSYGFRIAIDDFGSGYSSLITLKNFPIDILKLDKGFMREGTIGPKETIIVQSVIEMAESLGLEMVVEGAETKEQVMILRQIGCKMVQGFYYAKPMPISEFMKLVQKKK